MSEPAERLRVMVFKLCSRLAQQRGSTACGMTASYAVSFVLLLTVLAPSPVLSQLPLSVSGLRVEYLTNPVGIDAAPPRLSWRLVTTKRNTMQAAYQVQVASSEANLTRATDLLWDSGKVASDASVFVDYGGPPMGSRTPYYWHVRVWDASGRA